MPRAPAHRELLAHEALQPLLTERLDALGLLVVELSRHLETERFLGVLFLVEDLLGRLQLFLYLE